jgi:DNA-nicking Smr family endonuclease
MSLHDPEESAADEPVEIPIDGVLDLHTFRPKDVKDVVLEYLRVCREKGIYKVRIIHGKGIGQMRQMVHTLLERHPDVVEYVLAGQAMGGWGATIVTMKVRSS